MTNFRHDILDELEAIRVVSIDLKGGFKDTESRDWTASSLAAELCFQTSHVQYSLICRMGKKDSIGPLPGVDKGIDDEIADVLFNIMNVANFLGISVTQLWLSGFKNSPSASFSNDPMILSANLAIQAGNLWDATFRMDGYKHKVLRAEENRQYMVKALSGILSSLLFLAEVVNVDAPEAFHKMFQDARGFLNDYKTKHEVKET